MSDLLLTDTGDVYEQSVLISGWQQSLQSVKIRVHRFRGEWLLNDAAGLDYIGWTNRKSGNLVAEMKDAFELEIRAVAGVLDVQNLRVRLDDGRASVQARILLLDPDNPDVPVIVQLDTYEGTTRVVI